MDPFALTRSLIEIESVTGGEKAVGEFLFAVLANITCLDWRQSRAHGNFVRSV